MSHVLDTTNPPTAPTGLPAGTSAPIPGTSDLFAFASADGPLVYRDAGQGPLVVLLHAGFLDHTMWDAQIAELAREYRVIAPDARGHGGSANASQPFRQADDLAALVRHLDAGPAVLAGVSMGAMIAIDTAIEHPDVVRGLALSGRGAQEPDYSDPWSNRVQAAQMAALMAGDIEGWMSNFLLWASGPHRLLDEVDPAIVQRLAAMAARTLAKHTPGETDHTVLVTDTVARAARIAVPVLGLDGTLDSPDLIATVRQLLGSVADSRTVDIPGAAHYPNMEQPAAYNRALLDFLHELDAPPGA
ncbi:alpha/beta fold hydrolase [Yinghuangia soli]|uniref:Alpha/beta fold hydrolase n=1 Tax=Yinghuangia soli TaxID=2908204 RepID=A0AA41U247_9ACTN|nr:alpha/beta fold hydrolase [Yinghuangia soli]MCF2530326.1 alpha/beta fold hydrolase [Yinghuangia soli]